VAPDAMINYERDANAPHNSDYHFKSGRDVDASRNSLPIPTRHEGNVSTPLYHPHDQYLDPPPHVHAVPNPTFEGDLNPDDPSSSDPSDLVNALGALASRLDPQQFEAIQSIMKGKTPMQSAEPNPAAPPAIPQQPPHHLPYIHQAMEGLRVTSRPAGPQLSSSRQPARPLTPAYQNALGYGGSSAGPPFYCPPCPTYSRQQAYQVPPPPPPPQADSTTQALLAKMERMDEQFNNLQKMMGVPSLPVFHLPPSEMPVYRKYNGTGNPFIHLKEFMYESSFWQNDKRSLAFLFRRSLEGSALEWFFSLEPSEVEDYGIVSRKFIQRYQDRVAPSLSITDLIAEKMKPDEEFVSFADRWRGLAEKVKDHLSESEQVKMLISNATPQFKLVLSLNNLTSMAELYERAWYCQNAFKDATFSSVFDPHRPSRPPPRKPAVPNSTSTGPTTEGTLSHEQVSSMNNNSPQFVRSQQQYQRPPQPNQQGYRQ